VAICGGSILIEFAEFVIPHFLAGHADTATGRIGEREMGR
jgi:hypothetical protein